MSYAKGIRQHKPVLGPSFRFKDDATSSRFANEFPAREFLAALVTDRIHLEGEDVLVTLRGGLDGRLEFRRGDKVFELSREQTKKTSVADMVRTARDFDGEYETRVEQNLP